MSEHNLISPFSHAQPGCQQCHQLWAELGDVRREYGRLADAIRAHRAQRSDDRCWEDDQRLYAALGDGDLGDNRVGDPAAMLRNCERFIQQRCQGGGWPTYQQLEAENADLRQRLEIAQARFEAAQAEVQRLRREWTDPLAPVPPATVAAVARALDCPLPC